VNGEINNNNDENGVNNQRKSLSLTNKKQVVLFFSYMNKLMKI
jgi:hypothetical protein